MSKCRVCGYTEADAKFWMDHHLCSNAGNAPWERGDYGMKEAKDLRQIKKLTSIDADVLTGTVTFTDGMRIEITFGESSNPDAKFYVDGNPLGLKESDLVIVALARRQEGP